MGLIHFSERLAYLAHDPVCDRPMLAYLKGDTHTLAIDAGYSAAHVADFYTALSDAGLEKPNFTVLTHWHYDHTFGLFATKGTSIAHENTAAILMKQQKLAADSSYINALKQADPRFAIEYEGLDELTITLPALTYSDRLSLDLGNLTAHIFHATAPHSEDTTCIYVPEEGVLFLGDATSEDFFNDGYMDSDKLQSLIRTIEVTPCTHCILSHCEPLSKEDLLTYLYSLEA